MPIGPYKLKHIVPIVNSYWHAGIVILLHLVGIIGICLPATRAIFLLLTPLNLLITASLILLGAGKSIAGKYPVLLLVALIGYLVEVIGVATGLIFGNYQYGATLGLKLLEVPLLIGVNWFTLSYCTFAVIKEIRLPLSIKAALGACFMTAYDWVMEPVAVQLDFWSWANQQIPLQNYVGWFVTSYVLLQLIGRTEIKSFGYLPKIVLLVQLLFFCSLRFLL